MTRATSPPGRRLAPILGLALAAAVLAPGAARPERLPDDPVEKFKQALTLEYNKSYQAALRGPALDLAIAFRKKNLTEAAANVKSLSDLSQSLLLLEWPVVTRSRAGESDFALRSRPIEEAVRKSMTERFVKGLRQVMKGGKPNRQVAVANLISETVSGASDLPDERLALFQGLSPLTDDLVSLTKSDNAPVRAAAARALGQFPTKPAVVAQAMKDLLADRKAPEVAREAAADALVSLIQVVSGSRPLRPSEPGLPAPALQQPRQLFGNEEIASVLSPVIPAAAAGLDDPSVRVRERCAQALRQCATTLANTVDLYQRYGLREFPDTPPASRPWADSEIKAARERGQEIARFIASQRGPIQAFAKQADALLQAALDPSPKVRLEARRSLEELGRARRYLRELRESAVIPPGALDKKGGAGDKEDKNVRARPAGPAIVLTSGPALAPSTPPPLPLLRLPPPVRGALAQEEKTPQKKEKDAPKEDKKVKDAPKEDKKVKDAPKEDKPADTDEDRIGQLLGSVGDALVKRGFSDPRPASRRAAVEAVESSGDIGKRYIPRLVQALSDRDVFVRWIAARALGKLAPASPDKVVPALAGVLDDEDLDVRGAAAKALGQYGPEAKSAVSALGALVEKGDPGLRLIVLRSLEEIGTASAAALPNVARALNDLDPRIREKSARLIGRFGPRARAYAPALQKLTTDPDSRVRLEASAAILAIEEE